MHVREHHVVRSPTVPAGDSCIGVPATDASSCTGAGSAAAVAIASKNHIEVRSAALGATNATLPTPQEALIPGSRAGEKSCARLADQRARNFTATLLQTSPCTATFPKLTFLSLNGCILGPGCSLAALLKSAPSLEWLSLSGSTMSATANDTEFDEFLKFLGVFDAASGHEAIPGVADSCLSVIEATSTVAVFDDDTLHRTMGHLNATTNMNGGRLNLLNVSKDAVLLRNDIFRQFPSLAPAASGSEVQHWAEQSTGRFTLPRSMSGQTAATSVQHMVNSTGQLYMYQSPLILGIRCGAPLANTQALLQLGANPYSRDRTNHSVLCRTCMGVPDAARVAELLLSYSAPPLLVADAELDEMRAALQPASVWDKNVRWDGPFRFALMRGSEEITQLLLHHAVHQAPSPSQRWLQISALSHGQRLDIVRDAAEAAGVDIQSAFAAGPSERPACPGAPAAAEMAAGAGAGAADPSGESPRGNVAQWVQQLAPPERTMHTLNKALREVGPGLAQSPLHEAAHKGNCTLVQSLLIAGFSVWPRDKFRQLPLHCVALAAVSSPSRVMRMLQDAALDPVLAQDLASRVEAVQLMLDIGGDELLQQMDMYSQRACDVLADAVINASKAIARQGSGSRRRPAKSKLSGGEATTKFLALCMEGSVPKELQQLHSALLPGDVQDT